ncbi:ATP-binding protein [Streptomyces sp. P9(2023)]|uniref:ATP-binding protein n=1 Tax=Streptomyces sp. P9(2023) TaxID=3064394 RepID=UPI0028F456DC|nr:ATP-binding protein [Streptomyces sp. P9(2023)]MDT9690551.1 ATP-binding protein [Streptomyces sp. P9(2023)]
MKSEKATPTSEFVLRLSATRRGARLARLLAVQQLRDWDVLDTAAAELVVAELANNAATHGRVAGRDFEVRMERGEDHVRIEVSDTRGDREPVPVARPDEGGYGLVLVSALATAWGVKARCVGKTVWATVPLTEPRRGQNRVTFPVPSC